MKDNQVFLKAKKWGTLQENALSIVQKLKLIKHKKLTILTIHGMFVAMCVELGYKKEVNLICFCKNQMLLDSGTTIHVCLDKYIIEDKRTVNETVIVRVGTEIKSTLSGTSIIQINNLG